VAWASRWLRASRSAGASGDTHPDVRCSLLLRQLTVDTRPGPTTRWIGSALGSAGPGAVRALVASVTAGSRGVVHGVNPAEDHDHRHGAGHVSGGSIGPLDETQLGRSVLVSTVGGGVTRSEASLCALSAVVRGDPEVQRYVRQLPEYSALLRSLISSLSSPRAPVVVWSLGALLHLSRDSPLFAKLFDSANAREALALAFGLVSSRGGELDEDGLDVSVDDDSLNGPGPGGGGGGRRGGGGGGGGSGGNGSNHDLVRVTLSLITDMADAPVLRDHVAAYTGIGDGIASIVRLLPTNDLDPPRACETEAMQCLAALALRAALQPHVWRALALVGGSGDGQQINHHYHHLNNHAGAVNGGRAPGGVDDQRFAATFGDVAGGGAAVDPRAASTPASGVGRGGGRGGGGDGMALPPGFDDDVFEEPGMDASSYIVDDFGGDGARSDDDDDSGLIGPDGSRRMDTRHGRRGKRVLQKFECGGVGVSVLFFFLFCFVLFFFFVLKLGKNSFSDVSCQIDSEALMASPHLILVRLSWYTGSDPLERHRAACASSLISLLILADAPRAALIAQHLPANQVRVTSCILSTS
jgi:hypothetical protein